MDRSPIIARRIIDDLTSDLGVQVDDQTRERWMGIIDKHLCNDVINGRGSGICELRSPWLVSQFLDKYPHLKPVLDQALARAREAAPDCPVDVGLWVDPEVHGIVWESQELRVVILLEQGEDEEFDDWYERKEAIQDLLLDAIPLGTDGVRISVDAFYPWKGRIQAAIRWSDLDSPPAIINYCTRENISPWSCRDPETGKVDRALRTRLVDHVTALYEGESEPTDEDYRLLSQVLMVDEDWLRSPEPAPASSLDAGDIWTWSKE